MAVSERRKKTLKAWRQKNRDKLVAYQKEWRLAHPEDSLAHKRTYTANHLQSVRRANRDYLRYKLSTDLEFRILRNCRSRVAYAVRSQFSSKSAKTMELIDCTITDLKLRLEALFQEGMSWGNYGFGAGKWNIDHVRPCSSFDMSDPEMQRQCFHYSNLQPLWHKDNLAKSDRLPECQALSSSLQP